VTAVREAVISSVGADAHAKNSNAAARENTTIKPNLIDIFFIVTPKR
jgi:hypothetical protein